MKSGFSFGLSLLLSAGIAVSASAQTAPVDGAKIFKQRCSVCHKVEAGKTGGLGPNLRGVVGRKAASTAGFKYSSALGASGMMWTKPNLDKYIAAPTKTVPGTRMVIALPDAKQRAAVIEYLATQK